MPDSALINELANELDSWPGVRIERRFDGAHVVRYEHVELGILHGERGVAELPVSHSEHDEMIEHGDAEPDSAMPDGVLVTHAVGGPSDVTAVLALFDRRYRDVRGDEDPYSSQDPAG